MSSLLHRTVAGVALSALLLIVPARAEASPDTLLRSLGNIVFAPVDLVLSPVVATRVVYRNLRQSDDSMAVKIVYPVPGVVWVTGVQFGASVIRGVTGLIELGPAIPLAFMEADLDPLFDPVERNSALVDYPIGESFSVKFGVDYTSLPAY